METNPSGQWSAVLPAADLPEGKAVRATLGDTDLFLYRSTGRLFALDNRCSHQGGPLHKGLVRGGVQPTVACPVHGSVFRLSDGRVMRPPAMRPQRAFDVRERDGLIEIRPSA